MRSHSEGSINKFVSFNEKVGGRFSYNKLGNFSQMGDDNKTSPDF